MNSKKSYRNYKELRRKFYARTLVPFPGTRAAIMLRASMHAMDSTEDYLRFQAMNEEVDMPVKEAFIERIKRTRELAVVNQKAKELWPKKKQFDFHDLLAQLVV